MIKRAPLTFIIGFVVLACLIGWAEYKFVFQELLVLKDQTIKTLEEKASPGDSDTQGIVTAPGTGNAIATGTGNVANTGNSANVNNGTTSSHGKVKTPSH